MQQIDANEYRRDIYIMGELLFSIGFGGALIVVGIMTHVLLKKMSEEKQVETEQMKEERTV